MAARPDELGRSAGVAKPGRTVLVLGGGGMRGFTHIGVVRAIERLGLQIDEVIGTSMGAVMGGLFAGGYDSHKMEATVSEISLKSYFRLNLLKFLVRGYRHASVYKGKAFKELLSSWLPQDRFDDLEKPFFCNAISLTTGAARFFGVEDTSKVPVADAIYASACLPTIFEPAEIDGDHYIDGGMTESLALRLASLRAADLVIAVDLSHRDLRKPIDYRATLPHILLQTYELMGMALHEANLHRYVDDRTVVIKPRVSHMPLLEMPDVKEVVQVGEREAYETLANHVLTRDLCDFDALADEKRAS